MICWKVNIFCRLSPKVHDEMEDDEAEFEDIAATSAVMKDVFLCPETTITISDTGAEISVR